MQFDEIHAQVGGVPFIDPRNARLLYDRIVDEKLTSLLELGIAHGTGTCYMAAALDELGGGLVTAVDLVEARGAFQPSAEDQLEATGLGRFARVVREQTGYNWFLHDEIRRRTRDRVCEPVYDLCIIDGPKNWTIDGCAFFLVDKLLKPGGWIVFDDVEWSYEQADSQRNATDGITHRSLSDAERRTPQVKEIFELLVMQHPSYSEFVLHETGDWAWARKLESAHKTVTWAHHDSYRDVLGKLAHRARRRLRGGR